MRGGRERPGLGLTASRYDAPVPISSLNTHIMRTSVLASFLGSAAPLILREVTMPPFIIAGDQTSLGCDYDPQGEEIYSVKWYKGGREIFRYQPSLGERNISVYRRPGVHISEVWPLVTVSILLGVVLGAQ